MTYKPKANFIGIAVLTVVLAGLVVDAGKSGNDSFYADIIRLDNIATKIHQSYVEEVSSEDLVDNAVEGMMGMLDPHSTFFKRKQYDELRIHTEGKFGGLGIQISVRDKILTVMTPISGTPASRAGIQSGDQILEIDGESTKGISLEDAVSKLRGRPGTEVTITVRRKGEGKNLEYAITREVITINSVPFSGVIDNDIGYIRLVTFSQDAGENVEAAIKELINKGIKGMVFDLRRNPGGLLPQAREVAEKFLRKRALVVSTRGRIRGQNKEYLSSTDAVLPEDIPLVVLVDAASASASEIVAGAIQDWDRGIVLGDTTFGKGSVQSILPLDSDHHLKLTTAYYYTPSGRCINRPDNYSETHFKNDDEEEGEGTETENGESDDSTESSVDALPEYRTQNGRVVVGGGGIVPDTVVEGEMLGPVMRSLLLKDAFFKFATNIYPKLQDRNTSVGADFVVDEQVMNEFMVFLDTIDYSFKRFAGIKFDEFKQRIGLVPDTTADSASKIVQSEIPDWQSGEKEKLQSVVSVVDSLLEVEGRREFLNSTEEIKEGIKEALLVRELGQDNSIVYRTRLAADPQVKRAVSLLTDEKAYTSLLTPPKEAASR